MKAIILLGGFGKRLRPFTCHTPKPLLPILNQPEVLYQLELLKMHKIREVIFCLNYLSKNFLNYFGSGKKFNLKIHYLYEKFPLGTGGAIKNAEKFFGQEPVIILNGDILTDINLTELIKFHKTKNAVLTITLVRVKDPTIYGLVETDSNNKILQFLEKPSWDEVTCNTINAGIYVFNPELLQYIPPGINYSVERGLFPLLVEKKKPVYGYIPTNCYWLDIGTVEKYLQAHSDILNGILKVKISGKKIKSPDGGNLWIEKKVSLSRKASINAKAVIGENSTIESYVQFTGFVSIGRNCKINKGAQITNSVILDNTIIGEGVKIDQAVIGKNCRIDPNTVISNSSAIGDNTHITRFSQL